MWPFNASNEDDRTDENLKFLVADEEEQQIKTPPGVESHPSGISIQQAAVATTIIVLLIIDILCRVHGSTNSCQIRDALNRSTYLIGNGTVFEPASARDVVSYSPQNLTGMYTYNKTTKRLTRKQDAEVEFFGRPSRELDQIWENFLHHELPILLKSEEDVHQRQPNTSRWADGKFHFEPEVYHVLHCLNAVRQQVNRVLYPDVKISQKQLEGERIAFQDFTDNWTVLHTEHCMDRIRQDLLCHSNLTPSLFHAIDGVSIYFSNPGERICREWEPIRQWMEGRHAVGEQELKAERTKSEQKTNMTFAHHSHQ